MTFSYELILRHGVQ